MRMKKEKVNQLPPPPMPKTQDLPLFMVADTEMAPKPRQLPMGLLLPEIPKMQRNPEPKIPEKPKIQPPVFIKVSKYKEIVHNINNLKSYILALRDAMDVMREIQSELNKAMGLANRTLDHINIIAGAIDSRMISVQEPEERITDLQEQIGPQADIEVCIKDLYEHMEKIKSELKSISSE